MTLFKFTKRKRFPPTPESPYWEWNEYFAYILRRYGITKERWQEAWNKQKGKCALCRKKIGLVTDHDHKTNRFRGLLCFFCNGWLGKLEKNEARILKYLHPRRSETE